MYPLAVLDVQALMHVDKIAEPDTQVVSGDLIHLDFALLNVIGAQTNENRVSPLLPSENTIKMYNGVLYHCKTQDLPDNDRITSEELQSIHCRRVEGGHYPMSNPSASIYAMDAMNSSTYLSYHQQWHRRQSSDLVCIYRH